MLILADFAGGLDNEIVSKLDQQIDEIYQLPPGEFTAARNALAKTLTGDAARQVKALAKPAVVPWAVNQLYWQARPAYERLLKTGAELRAAQLAALKGRGADVRRATEAHRTALAGAVQRSTELAAASGAHPDAEALARTLEALSLSAKPPEAPGRLTKPLQPAGFEALAGMGAISAAAAIRPTPVAEPERKDGGHTRERKPSAREAARARQEAAAERARLKDEEKREREEAAERRRREAAVHAAERALEDARAAERRVREQFEAAQSRVIEAEQRLATARAHAR